MSNNSRTKNSALNFISGIGGELIKTVLHFIVRTVFIQTLGKSYLGINGLFSNILTMLSLTELGMDTAINFKLYKPLAEHDEKRVRVLMKFYRDFYRVVGVVIFFGGLCTIPILPRLINEYDKLDELGINAIAIFVMLLSKNVASYMFMASRSAIIKADQRTYILTVADYIIDIVQAVTEILILVYTNDFMLYSFCGICFTVTRNFVDASIAKKHYAYAFLPEKESLSLVEIKDTFRDLGALFVYKVNGVVLKATDNIVLSSFIGLTIVGTYSNYIILYSTIRSFISKAFTAIKASTGNLFATADVKRKYEFFLIMNFVSALLYGIACVGVAIVADELIEVWIGADYVIPKPFSVLLGIELIFVGVKLNLGQIRNVSGAFRQGWWRPLMSIVINLTVSILLVKRLGICGVLIGTICADFLSNFLFDPYVIHKYTLENYRPVSEYYINNIQYALATGGASVIAAYLCNHLFVGYGWISVVLHSVVCALSVLMFFLICFFKRFEFQYLLKKTNEIIVKLRRKK